MSKLVILTGLALVLGTGLVPLRVVVARTRCPQADLPQF